MPSEMPKGKSQLGTLIPTDLYEALRDLSEESGVPITRLTEDAIRALLKERTGQEFPR